MLKSEIRISYHRGGSSGLPMVNVKARHFPSPDVSENAWQWMWEMAQHMFWEEAKYFVEENWKYDNAEVYSAGRSDGWAVVYGLPPVDSWDAIYVMYWARFVKWCEGAVQGYTDDEFWAEEIAQNRWNEEGAEKYNFFEKEDGSIGCIAEMKAEAIAAGFGQVVRS